MTMTRAEVTGIAIGALAGALLLALIWPTGAPLTLRLVMRTLVVMTASVGVCWLVGRRYSRKRHSGKMR